MTGGEESTSRILVKNLPKYITQERLKAHFSSHGTITDLKLIKTKTGNSRRFCYIGFKTDQEGLDAVKYFNNTFIDTMKISVETAFSIGNESIPRAWSKYSAGSSAFIKQNPPEKKEDKKELTEKQQKFLKDIDVDEDFEEFMSVMRPRNAAPSKTWANDDFGKDLKIVPVAKEDDDLYQELPSKFLDDEESESEEVAVPSQTNPSDKSIAFDDGISDMEYFKMKMAKEPPVQEKMKVNPGRMELLKEAGVVDEDLVENTIGTELAKSNQDESKKVTFADSNNEKPEVEVIDSTEMTLEKVVEEPSPDLIADTGRIMVRNLPYSCTYEDLESHFKKFGPIAEIHLPIDKITKESKGYAFVLYVMPENAIQAFTTLDKSIFQGRILEIVAAKEKPEVVDEIHPVNPSSFKAKREAEMKKKASNDFNWNSLFMNSDAVAEAMARNLGVRKSEILDASSNDMAVRLALAETNIIKETKEYLEEQGVSLESFTGKRTRSNTIILVKNIPASTEEDDLIKSFSEFGELHRVILPPARTIALVEFAIRNEAKVAFRKLAYSKFKGVPLYLEWAPEGTFASDYDPKQAAAAKRDMTKKIASTPEVDELPPAATIFVKNLNFETTDEGLKNAFEGIGGLRSARISKKANPKYPGQKMSMGFGFLEFQTKEDAMKCIKTMQKFHLDGHELSLKFSNNASKPSEITRKRASQVEANEENTKLIVRNLPFEATRKDLKQLFSSFGSVKTVRVPRKFDGQHRGFGFVSFLTHQDAKTALETLGATHLYGRHLVLEWAKEEESMEEMREKTAKNFKSDAPVKKRRIEMEEEEEY